MSTPHVCCQRHIAVDMWGVRPLTGIFRYGISILRQLVEQTKWTFVVFGSTENQDELARWLNGFDRVTLDIVQETRKILRDSSALQYKLESGKFDLYYTPEYLIHANCCLPAVVTIHDLIRLEHPELTFSDADVTRLYGRDELNRLYQRTQELHSLPSTSLNGKSVFLDWFEAETLNSIQTASAVATPSQVSLKKIMTFFPQAAGKLFEIAGGVDSTNFFPRGESEVIETLRRMGLPENFLLFVGGSVRQHKQTSLLAEILTAALNIDSTSSLVIVAHGDLDDKQMIPLRGYITDGQAQCVGPLSDDELACLYSAARATVIISASEGYCLPARESLACGTQVLAPSTLDVLSDLPADAVVRYDRDSIEPALKILYQGQLFPRTQFAWDGHFDWISPARALADILCRAVK